MNRERVDRNTAGMAVQREGVPPKPEGFALALAVIYLGLISLIAGTFVVAVNRDLGAGAEAIDQTKLRYAAESGIALALDHLEQGRGRTLEIAGALGECRYAAAITQTEDGAYRIVSRASLDPASPARGHFEIETSARLEGDHAQIAAWSERYERRERDAP